MPTALRSWESADPAVNGWANLYRAYGANIRHRSLVTGGFDVASLVRESITKARPKPGLLTTATVYVINGGIAGGTAVVGPACGVTWFPQYGHTTQPGWMFLPQCAHIGAVA